MGLCVAQVGELIIVKTGSFCFGGSSARIGNPFEYTDRGVSGSISTDPCRVKVFQIS